ncbi:MAG: hypothetical protein WCP21_02685, partial [Armatimonadota bacterium]
TAPKAPQPPMPVWGYKDRVFGTLDGSLRAQLAQAETTYYAGEAVPRLNLSFGPDECSVFCGAQFGWSDDSGDTNWCVPCIDDWSTDLPLALVEQSPLFQRMLAMYRLAADLGRGKALLTAPDLHTNMDLLAGMRWPQKLCYDLLDCPELIDRAMDDARAVFPKLWDAIWEAGVADCGYVPTTSLQCDFSCMISPVMFRRWVLPALEEEAAIVGHVTYHWDGPGALVHTDDLVASHGLGALDYVPGTGAGSHVDFLDLFKRVQAGGKGVSVWGSSDEVKLMHRELNPELTIFHTSAASPQEADAVLEWFVANT